MTSGTATDTQPQPRRGLSLQMACGERALTRKGRWGTLTQVNVRQVAIRLDGMAKAVWSDRTDVIPQRWLDAQAEVDEDDANAQAFRKAGSK